MLEESAQPTMTGRIGVLLNVPLLRRVAWHFRRARSQLDRRTVLAILGLLAVEWRLRQRAAGRPIPWDPVELKVLDSLLETQQQIGGRRQQAVEICPQRVA